MNTKLKILDLLDFENQFKATTKEISQLSNWKAYKIDFADFQDALWNIPLDVWEIIFGYVSDPLISLINNFGTSNKFFR